MVIKIKNKDKHDFRLITESSTRMLLVCADDDTYISLDYIDGVLTFAEDERCKIDANDDIAEDILVWASKQLKPQPFDPNKIDVEVKNVTLSMLIDMLENDLIDLYPSFQRRGDLWSIGKKSQLVESILLRLPLPSFYFEYNELRKKWIVVDGLQRLCTLKSLIDKDKPLVLNNLDFIGDKWNGKTWSDFTHFEKVNFGLNTVTINILKGETPPAAKFILFKRLNSGGTPLRSAEIRNALCQGNATLLIADAVAVLHSKLGNAVSSKRMNDHNFVMRFMAFMIGKYEGYSRLDDYLTDMMDRINYLPNRKIKDLKNRFCSALDFCVNLQGNLAFRNPKNEGSCRVSIALFESMMRNADALNDAEKHKLLERSKVFNLGYRRLFEDQEFQKALSGGTGQASTVKARFEKINNLIRDILDDDKVS